MQENTTEQQNNANNVSGLRIRNLNYIFIVSLLALAVVIFVITGILSLRYDELIRTTDDYHRIEKDARMVQSASDELTRDAQLFVMTGGRNYLDAYFKEADETKRRETAIKDLEELDVTDSLISLLENSVKESMNLMLLEYEAMRYAAEGYGYDIEDLPKQIQRIKLPETAKNMTDAEKIDRAQEIAYGPEYYAYKMRISGYEDQYLEKALLLMDEIQQEEKIQIRMFLLVQRITLVLIGVIGLILFFAIARMVVHPLDNAVNSIAGGERINPISGTYEIKYMSQTYNEFHQDSMDLQKRLKQDAERDELTGVLNRRGYHMVIDRLASETYPIALLVMDVDDFKLVNDQHGHSMGDVALKKVAHLLLHTFRGTDITSRIGGDEFTVIMSGITESNTEVIIKKINLLNDTLKNPGTDDCPPMSLSVGCAFSHAGYNSHLFAVADEKMYEAKQAGGGTVRFAQSLE